MRFCEIFGNLPVTTKEIFLIAVYEYPYMEIDREQIREAAIRKRNYNLAVSATSWLTGIAGLILSEYGRLNVIHYNEILQNNSSPSAINFFREVPSHLTLIANAIGLSFEVYGASHVLNISSTFNPKKWFRGLLYTFNSFFNALKTKRDYAKTIELAKLTGDPILEQRVIAEVDFKEGRIDDAFKRYDDLLQAIPYDSIPEPLIWKIIQKLGEYSIYLLPKDKRKVFQSENPLIHSAFSYFKEGSYKKAKESFEEAIKSENKNIAEVNLLYAYFLDLVRDKKAKEQFAKTAALIESNPENKFESLEGTKNRVYILSGDKYISNSLIIKTNPDLAHLQGEREIIDCVVLENKDERFCLPEHLEEIVQSELGYKSKMKRDRAETLWQMIKTGHPDLERNLEDISDFLALIYCSVPLGILPPKESDISTITERLDKAGIDIDTILRITENLEPVSTILDLSTRVYKKDPHVLNWGIRKDGKIIAFDFEPAPAIPLEEDLANLTDTDGFSQELKDKMHKRVIVGFNSRNHRGIKIDLNESRLALAHGVLMRTFKLYGPLSQMSSLSEIRLALVSNGTAALNNIENNFSDYFNSSPFKVNYAELRRAIADLV